MKILNAILAASISLAAAGPMTTVQAATTVDAANRYAYGANIGWVDGRGDTNNGAVIGEYVCSGNIYSANVGWINLGSGAPTNGIYYQNLSTNDFGVNQDGAGNLRGLAYGANIGWVNFETNGAPKVNLQTGQFSGYAYGANVGWIALSNAVGYVQTDTIVQGALSTNGLPVAWLLQNFGTTNVNASADADHDGVSNLNEYLAGTDPNNGSDYLHIINYSMFFTGANETHNLTWTSHPTRVYQIQNRTNLITAPAWFTNNPVIAAGAGTNTTAAIAFGNTVRPQTKFLRVAALRPLMP